MDFKRLILRTVIWTATGLVLAALAAWYVVSHPIRGFDPAKRAEQMGRSVGIVVAIGWGVIWIPAAYREGQERRRVAARGKAKPRKKGRRR